MSNIEKQLSATDKSLLEDFNIKEFFPYLLNQSMSNLNICLRGILAKHDLTIHQWRVLFMLKLRGPVSVGDISAGTVMGQSTITRVVDQLEISGMAFRSPKKGNARIILVELTDAGERFITDLIPEVFAISDNVLENFDPGEQVQLFKLLDKLASNLREFELRQKVRKFEGESNY